MYLFPLLRILIPVFNPSLVSTFSCFTIISNAFYLLVYVVELICMDILVDAGNDKWENLLFCSFLEKMLYQVVVRHLY